MQRLGQVTRTCHVESAELRRWITRRWVLPAREGRSWMFTETDVARVRMIRDLKEELAIDDDALPVILSLLDQVYQLRRTLRDVTEAVAALDEPARSQVLGRLEKPARRRS